MGERRRLQKRRKGRFGKSHGRIACGHHRVNTGSWRVSRQPGRGCVASFVCMQEFSHWRVFAAAACGWRMSGSSTPTFDRWSVCLTNAQRFAYGRLSDGVCNARRIAWTFVGIDGNFCVYTGYLMMHTFACTDASPLRHSRLSKGGFPHYNIHWTSVSLLFFGFV